MATNFDEYLAQAEEWARDKNAGWVEIPGRSQPVNLHEAAKGVLSHVSRNCDAEEWQKMVGRFVISSSFATRWYATLEAKRIGEIFEAWKGGES